MGAERSRWTGPAVVAALIVGALLALGVTAYLLTTAGPHRGTDAAIASKADRRVFAARAVVLSRELRSGDVAQLADALAVPRGVVVESAAVKSLATLRAIVFEAKTLRERGGSATVRAMVTNSRGATQVWTVTLVRRDDQWKIAQSDAVS